MVTKELVQSPAPGARLIAYCGDMVEFTLLSPPSFRGTAWVRTNIGRADIYRKELIDNVELGTPVLAHDWHDILMRKTSEGRYVLQVPVCQTGRFEAKTFFMPEDENDPLWPDGPNTCIKVEPAITHGCNTIYTAFTRQFGPNRFKRQTAPEQERSVETLDNAGYVVIPKSGTFRDLGRELDFIINTLGFRILQLLPVHPTPSVYGRMGRFGSPFAALDFMSVDPALAEFDRRTTPLEQFVELVHGVHRRGARIFLDIPVNHTGWASWLQTHHPEWFVRKSDRTFQSPGAWGVVWEDLARLDYNHKPLWTYMADVFLHWCRLGVDGFRCDAGYMVPSPAWEYIVARVRREYPDTTFLLEGLGGDPKVVESLLADANLDWAYSELFQNEDRAQIESYLPVCNMVSQSKGSLVHFAETHDNNRLASRSHTYARMRLLLNALCSDNGAFGITAGVEWFATEKIAVHGAPSLDWGSRTNLLETIAATARILEGHPCFLPRTTIRLVHRSRNASIAVLRQHHEGHSLLVVACLGDKAAEVTVDISDVPFANRHLTDLITHKTVAFEKTGNGWSLMLEPGQVLCLTPEISDLQRVRKPGRTDPSTPEITYRQTLRAKILDVFCHYRGVASAASVDFEQLAGLLETNPLAFCAACSRQDPFIDVVSWQWPQDRTRNVMVPPGRLLFVQSPHRFIAEIRDGEVTVRKEHSMPRRDGGWFVLSLPLPASGVHKQMTLSMTVFGPEGTHQMQSPLLCLASTDVPQFQTSFGRNTIHGTSMHAVCANRKGAMAQVRANWGRIESQYDALLAANMNPSVPTDRRTMLVRCRVWLVHRGYSHEVNGLTLQSFTRAPGERLVWDFLVPCGLGKMVPLTASYRLLPDRNAATIEFHRTASSSSPDALDDRTPVTFILRPDVDDRSPHETTKAFRGPENSWRQAVASRSGGFEFAPSATRRLLMHAGSGTFTLEPEWTYMTPLPFEATRGLDSATDLFSPGYFRFSLHGGSEVGIYAEVSASPSVSMPSVSALPAASDTSAPETPTRPLLEVLRDAMETFLAERDGGMTVIAGYPWFLDWGRDTLICLRGLLSAGHKNEARGILEQFGKFEQNGTLPNMINGTDVSNRDTSDAPLWFIIACRDYASATGNLDLLSARAGHRTFREVVLSIARGYIEGTPNGIRMDRESGLIFSPAHFTWMDTNHPAATPREGYPIEIQALWCAALKWIATWDSAGEWADLASRVATSVSRYFQVQGQEHLSDCLHCGPGTPAASAAADDALRPNQLLAVTLGAISDRATIARVVSSSGELLVPGAIRSLADRPVNHPIPVVRNGVALNDPVRPYWGTYEGDEDTRRKPSYHNGTAWTWMFPSYAEACFLLHGDAARPSCVALLSSCTVHMETACAGQVPEIVDGNSPHRARGCGAQAWGATEFYRVLALILDVA